MCGLLGLHYLFLSLHGMGIVQTRAFARIAHWVPIPVISLPFHGLVGHVGQLGLLPLSLGFLGPITSSLPLILLMGLLAVILAMLAHWACYLFSWASSTHLLHFYFLFLPWACCLLFLPCWPIGLATSFLGLPRPAYFIFTSYYSHGPVGYHSSNVDPLGLLPLFLGFLSPLTSFLPLIPPMGPQAVIPTMLAHWVN